MNRLVTLLNEIEESNEMQIASQLIDLTTVKRSSESFLRWMRSSLRRWHEELEKIDDSLTLFTVGYQLVPSTFSHSM